MRSRALALLLPLVALAPAAAAEPPAIDPPPAEGMQTKRPKLQVDVDRDLVDLKGHTLQVKLSRPADKVRIKVVGLSGATLAEVEKSFGGAAPGTVLAMSWAPSSEEQAARIEVWGYDTDGYYAGVAVTPWLEMAHQEINFDSDSDVIKASEAPKLEAPRQQVADMVAKYPDYGKATLYIAGYTDTVGSTDHNLTLSRNRARAVGSWFRAHGIKIPIAYEGVGKAGLLVKTADQVDELRNRRIVLQLGTSPPSLPAGEFSWKTL